MKSIDDIIEDALCHIESLYCLFCDTKVNFEVVERKTAHCLECNHVLTVNYEDLKPVGMLPPRSGILRFNSRFG